MNPGTGKLVQQYEMKCILSQIRQLFYIPISNVLLLYLYIEVCLICSWIRCSLKI